MSLRRTATRMRMFADIERMDAQAWAAHLAPDVVMRVGNDDPIYGRERCQVALAALYSGVDGRRHEVVELWEHGAATIVEANVTYTRTDGSEVTLPLVTIYRADASGLISDYRVYVDMAPVLAPVAAPSQPSLG